MRATPSLLRRVIKVMPACMLWGAGTAIGEIPPYALSYAAAAAQEQQKGNEGINTGNSIDTNKSPTLLQNASV